MEGGLIKALDWSGYRYFKVLQGVAVAWKISWVWNLHAVVRESRYLFFSNPTCGSPIAIHEVITQLLAFQISRLRKYRSFSLRFARAVTFRARDRDIGADLWN